MNDEIKIDKKTIIWIVLCLMLSRLFIYLLTGFTNKDYSLDGVVNRLNIYDAEWYKAYVLSIVNFDFFEYAHINATDLGQAYWAFFPLYPICVAIFYVITGKIFSIYLTGMVLSSVCFLVAMIYGYKYILLTRNDRYKAYLYIFLMCCGPYNIYFFIMYTESMFLMLLTMSFFYLKRKQYLRMGICGALMSATRNVGVFFVFVILAELIAENCKDGKFSLSAFITQNIKKTKLVLGICMVPLGLFTYMLVLINKLGDGLAFVHVQKAWRRISGLSVLYSNIKYALWDNFPPDILQLIFFFSILMILSHIIRGKYEEAVLPSITLFVSSMSSFASIPRFMMGMFTIELAIVDQIFSLGKKKRIVVVAILLIFAISILRGWLLENGFLI